MHEIHNLKKNKFLYVFVSVGGYVQTYAGTQGGQKKAFVPPELELQTVVSHQLCMLRTQLWYSTEQCILLSTEPSPQAQNAQI